MICLKKSMLHIQMYTCLKLVQFSWYCIYVCLNNHSKRVAQIVKLYIRTCSTLLSRYGILNCKTYCSSSVEHVKKVFHMVACCALAFLKSGYILRGLEALPRCPSHDHIRALQYKPEPDKTDNSQH